MDKLIDKLSKKIDDAVHDDGINADVADKLMLIIAEMEQLNILLVSNRRELLSKFYSHLCDIAVIDSEYRTDYDKKTIPDKFTL